MMPPRVLGSTEQLRTFLSKLANLDFQFLAPHAVKAGLDNMYWMMGPENRHMIYRIGHRAGTEVTESQLDAELAKMCSQVEPQEKIHITRFLVQYEPLIPLDPRRDLAKRDSLLWLLELQGKLRQVWSYPSRRAKHYGAFWLLEQLVAPNFKDFLEKKDVLVVPQEIAFERAVLQLVEDWDLARACENLDCRNPYFFASRTSQKYCSIKCAKPAIRAAKLRWWKRQRRGENK